MERALSRGGYPFLAVRIRFTRRLRLSTLRTLGSIPVAGVDACYTALVSSDCVARPMSPSSGISPPHPLPVR